jgi:predicted secreted protein
MAGKHMKPCPRCMYAYWQTGGKTRIHYIPKFMELCRDCCDPGEDSLNEREKDQFYELVRRERNNTLNQRKKKVSGSVKKFSKSNNTDK